MNRRELSAVFFDAMGTILALRPWVTAMTREFSDLSKTHNVKLDDIYQVWSAEWKKVNEEVRKDKPFRNIRELFFEAFTAVGKKVDLQLSPKDIWEIIERVTSYVNKNAISYPDVRETVEALKREGYKVGIISDADKEDLTLQLESAGILQCFDTITTSSEAESYKPNSKIFKVALARMNCRPVNACHIGDSQEFDVTGANSMGLHSILVTHGRAEMHQNLSKPAYIIQELKDIVPILCDSKLTGDG
ncbi:MAG: HAD family hydrolase [Candidatus Atabeyarchaeum deiterrae]